MLTLSSLLDISISMVFVYLTLSLFVSGIVEFINTFSEKRSELLKLALDKLLGSTVFEQFWNHPLTKLKEQKVGGFRKPIAYLSANSFSTVLIDLIVSGKPIPSFPAGVTPTTTQITLATIRDTITNDPLFVPLKPLIDPMLEKADTLPAFIQALERWYDGYMEQVSGWFKRYAQGIVWAVSIGVTLTFNVDTITIAKRVANDKVLRESLVKQAEAAARRDLKTGVFSPKSTPPRSASTVKTGQESGSPLINSDTTGTRAVSDTMFLVYLSERDVTLVNSLTAGEGLTSLDSIRVQDFYLHYLQENLAGLGLPIGWTFPPQATGAQISGIIWHSVKSWALLGWLLTAAALSFGAPFWFELLLKLVNIRNVTRKPARADGSQPT